MATKYLIWKKKDLNYLEKTVEDLKQLFVPKKQGGFRVGNHLLEELIIESITDSIIVSRDISYDDLRIAVFKGIRRFVVYRNRSLQSLRRAINTELRAIIFRKRNKKYIAFFFTPSNLHRKLEVGERLSIMDNDIIFSNWYDVRKNIDVDTLFAHIGYRDNSNLENGTIPTLIHFKEKARPIYSYFENHIKPYELFRAAINYSLNYGGFALGGRSFLPYNEYLPNNYVGYFDGNGKYITYSYTFAKYKTKSMFNIRKSKLERALEIFEKYSLTDPTNEFDLLTSKLILRYNYALDSLDFGATYFGLWRVLENIVFPKGEPDYKRIGNRVNAILKSDDHIKRALGAITVGRHRFFHKEAFFPSTNTLMVDFLKFINEYLLEWMIKNPINLSTEKELMKYINENEDIA